MKILYPFLFLFSVHPAFSETLGNPCQHIEVSQQVAQCAAYKQQQSDEHLNSNYKATLDRIRNQYGKIFSLAEQYISLVREAQKNWIKLRDADCKLEAFEVDETTEAYQAIIDNCHSRMSDDRSNYLKRIATDI